MISVIELHQFLTQTQRSGFSGYDSAVEWNTNCAVVDNELYRTLVPYYAKDDRIQKLLNVFVETLNITLVNGSYDIDPDIRFNKYIDTIFGSGNKIVYPRNLNEKSVIQSSSIDNPTLDSDEYYVFFDGERLSYLPAELKEGKLVFLRKPIPGEIAFTEISTEDRDYYSPTSVRDIEWPEEMFSLFAALMLEKYGYQNREAIAVEFSRLGIQREIYNTER